MSPTSAQMMKKRMKRSVSFSDFNNGFWNVVFDCFRKGGR